MRTLALILVLMLLAAWPAAATVYTAADSQAGTINTILASTVNGDKVIVPSVPATWSTRVSIVNGVWLCGGGGTNGVTSITDGAGVNGRILDVDPHNSSFAMVSGFRFTEVSSHDSSHGFIGVHCNTGSFFWFASNTVNCITGMNIWDAGDSPGLISYNYFTLTDGDCWLAVGFHGVQNGTSFGSTLPTDSEWSHGVRYGSTNYVYIEHNTVYKSNNTSFPPDGPLEGYAGAMFVVRYNSFTNSALGGWHGTDTGSMISPHSYEVYGNLFIFNNSLSAGWGWCFNGRGGTGLIYSNTMTGPFVPHSLFNVQVYRNPLSSTFPSDCGAAGLCGSWGTMTGSNPYDGNQSADGYPGLAQSGTTGPLAGFVYTGTGASSTIVQSPIYCWGNTGTIITDGAPKYGREYLTNSPTYSGGTYTNFHDYTNASGANVPNTLSYTPLADPFPIAGASATNPPSITSQPVTVTVATNNPATFSLTATGSGTLAYQWYWTATNVPGATSSSWSTPPTIIAWSNSPVFAIVTNSFGSVTSATVFLEVTNRVLHTYYMATNGSDTTGDGSVGNPWATVGHATGLMAGGDTLYIRGGTYGQIFDILGPSGSSTAPTFVLAYPSETPVFNENNIQSGAHSIDTLSWLVLGGVTIMSNNIGIAVGVLGPVTNVVLTNLTVAYIGQQGLQIEKNSQHVSVLNCTVHDTGLWIFNGEGIYVGQGDSAGVTDNTHDVLIQGSTFYNTSDEGIELKGGTYNVTVSSNVLHDCNLPQNSYGAGGGAIEVDEEGANNFWPSNPNQVVAGNLVYNTFIGIRAATGGQYYNNVAYNCTNQGILLNNNGGQAANPGYTRFIYNNTVYQPTATAIVSNSAASSIILNNIGRNSAWNLPVNNYFVNAAGHDFHLIGGTAPVKSGTNLFSVVATDFDGNARPATGAFDIGAYVYSFVPTGTNVNFVFWLQ